MSTYLKFSSNRPTLSYRSKRSHSRGPRCRGSRREEIIGGEESQEDLILVVEEMYMRRAVKSRACVITRQVIAEVSPE